MTSLKIAIICHKISQGGGVANYVKNLRQSLLNSNEVSSVRIIETTHQRKLTSAINFIKSLSWIFILSLTGRIDIAHIHMSSRGSTIRKITIALLCLLLRKPYILHIHSGEYPEFYRSLSAPSKSIIRFALNKASSVVVLGETWKTWFQKNINLTNLAVVHNGIPDISDNLKPTNPKESIVFAGRLTKNKGIHDLIAAFNVIGSLRKNCELIVIGDGTDPSQLISQVKPELKDSIIFKGWLTPENCHKIISECSLLVLPSYYEGLPICILEAMCLSKPVVATNVGAIPEVIFDEHNGITFSLAT